MSQAETVTVPGRNSPIRFNEALGLVSFEPRAFTLTFSMLGKRVKFDELVSIVSNRYAGRLCQIICSEEPNLYVLGTIEMSSSYDPLTGKGQLVKAVMQIPTGIMWKRHRLFLPEVERQCL